MNLTELERLLPGAFQQTLSERNPLGVILGFMEHLHGPVEETLDNVERFFDPRRTTAPFVPYLASWVDLAWTVLENPDPSVRQAPRPFPPGLGRLRELVAQAAYHAKLRGTAEGLAHLLETATGLSGFVIDEAVPGPDGRPIPYHIRVRGPSAAAPYAALIRRIVEHEKPAHVTCDPDLMLEPLKPPPGTSSRSPAPPSPSIAQ